MRYEWLINISSAKLDLSGTGLKTHAGQPLRLGTKGTSAAKVLVHKEVLSHPLVQQYVERGMLSCSVTPILDETPAPAPAVEAVMEPVVEAIPEPEPETSEVAALEEEPPPPEPAPEPVSTSDEGEASTKKRRRKPRKARS